MEEELAANEKAEQEKVQDEIVDKERLLTNQKAEKEAKEKIEAERLAQEKLAKQKSEKEKIETLAKEKADLAAKEAKMRAEADKAVKEKWVKEEAEAEKKSQGILAAGAVFAGLLLYYFFKPSSTSSSYDKPVVLPITNKEEENGLSKKTDLDASGVKAAFEATNVLNTVDQLQLVKDDAELDSQQVEEDAGRAESLSVRINDRTDDISNQMNGTNDSFDQSIEDVEGNEKNTSPVCENSVNMREIASDDGLDASDLAFATDIATVSERSANE